MFDVNTAIGHWPFRRIPNQRADELRALLEARGIQGAAVAHTHGLFYMNCHDANLELADAVAAHAGFFVGVATLNPTYAAWERDLATCVQRLGLRALRLVPQYHGYRLSDTPALDLARAASAAGMALVLPHRVVDVRQRHWLDTEQTTALSEVLGLCRAVPEARVLLTEWAGPATALVTATGQPLCPNLYIETSRLPSAYGQTLSQIVKALGASQVLFGSGAPFKEVRPALLKLEHAELAPAEREGVAGGSARSWLGLS
jgi:predicted TIM-barrel fold metal-dependent hydrolase